MIRWVNRWITSECGRFDIESPGDGITYILNEHRAVDHRYSKRMAWVKVGEFNSLKEAMAEAEKIKK